MLLDVERKSLDELIADLTLAPSRDVPGVSVRVLDDGARETVIRRGPVLLRGTSALREVFIVVPWNAEVEFVGSRVVAKGAKARAYNVTASEGPWWVLVRQTLLSILAMLEVRSDPDTLRERDRIVHEIQRFEHARAKSANGRRRDDEDDDEFVAPSDGVTPLRRGSRRT